MSNITELDLRELRNRLKYLKVLKDHKLDDLFFKNMNKCKEFLNRLLTERY